MSHILFAEYTAKNYKKEALKVYAKKYDVYYWFNNEITFYAAIHEMYNENKILENSELFCLTSKFQPINSDDLLLPFDKYEQKELFPNGNNRKVFEQLCRKNLNEFDNIITNFIEIAKPLYLRIFVTEVYDIGFKIVKCSVNDMLEDMYKQIIHWGSLGSKIYEIIENNI
jgi:hypothetical protein